MNTVQVVNAGLTQFYPFSPPPNAPPVNFAISISNSGPIPKDGVYSTHQVSVAGTGAVGATVLVQATNDPTTAGQDDISNRKFQNILITTNGTTTITNAQGYFRSEQTGNEVYASGVPNGATFTYSSPYSGTLSAAAITSITTPARFQAKNWVLLGTITLAGTTTASDGLATVSSWKWTRISVTAISGTNAAVVGIQGN